MTLACVLKSSALIGALVLVSAFSLAADKPTAPTVPAAPPTFETVARSDNFIVQVDKSTVALEKDDKGEPLGFATFKIIAKDGIEVDGKMAQVFVNSVVAVCGYNKIVVIEGSSFTKDGELIKTSDEPMMMDITGRQTPAYVAYRLLCGEPVTQKSKAPSGYKGLET
jgi:hypothetical protein